MNRLQPIAQDEFLAAAPLFRYGPRALMGVGFLLCASVLAVSFWRVGVSRQAEYERAFHLAAVSAKSVQAATTQVFALLRQTTRALQAAPRRAETAASRQQLASGLDLEDQRIRAFVVGNDGRVRAASTGVDPDGPALQAVMKLLPPPAAVVELRVLPAMAFGAASARVVPVVQPLALPGGVRAIVYLVDADLFAAEFFGALDGKAGWLRLSDGAGKTVLDVTQGMDPRASGELVLQGAMRSPAQALATAPEAGSQRLLLGAASSPTSPLAVMVGLNEADALQEMTTRHKMTWAVVLAGFLGVTGLVTVTSLALRKFATKETHLRRLATIDILTGLPNRRSFQELLSKAVQTAQRRQQIFGLLFVDLDNFKDVNDSMGHEAGDALLQQVGEVLLRTVREGDRVCRLGGDEFTVLLSELGDVDEAQRIGQRILQALEQPRQIRDVEVLTQASIGVALMPLHATTPSALMRMADIALYRAKQGGRGQCLVYDDLMAVQALEKSQRIRELGVAIAQHQLFLEYQPKFSLHDGAVTGFEALVRWRHPLRGVVGPGEFIALAEEAGLIVDLGQWVLERAVRQQRQWHDAGAGWQQVAVNVSALQLRSGHFASRVQEVLQRHQVPGTQLQLELTESALVVDVEQARDLVCRLRALGLSIAVDDFGTGYSSLAALQQLDIDTLKVDRSFVGAIETRGGEAICKAIVSLAHALEMQVVAEGVETAAQRDTLHRLGCDQVQGFLYARPMAAERAFESMRRPWNAAPGSLRVAAAAGVSEATE